jgi:VIT1/CCC1 family predicted Fe2+/Mn2+ transporter
MSEEDSGWLRASVFGSLDGLTTSAGLVIGLTSSGLDTSAIIASAFLAGLAGSVSMAGGEFVSVSSHNEQPDAHKFNPWTAAIASFLCFAIGSIIPIIPLFYGFTSILALGLNSAVALFIMGAFITRWTTRSWWFGGLRQLIVGLIAAGVSFGLGTYLS